MLDVYITLSFNVSILILFALKYPEASYEQKVLGFLFVVTLPFEAYGGYLQSFRVNNLFIYHVLIPVQYAFYALIYYQCIESTSVKKSILLSVPLVAAAAIGLAFTIQPVSSYNSYVIVLCNLLILAWIMIYYRQIFVQLKIIRLGPEPMFWISTGLLFYCLGSFFVEGLMKRLIEQSPQLATRYYYNIFMVLVSFLYIMFMIAFLGRDFFTKYERARYVCTTSLWLSQAAPSFSCSLPVSSPFSFIPTRSGSMRIYGKRKNGRTGFSRSC